MLVLQRSMLELALVHNMELELVCNMVQEQELVHSMV